ncbi:MAG: phenylalanine--tRNA ligase subunit alpha, partial [Alphaproteobacteria bacterium]
MADLETPEKLKADLLAEVAGARDLAALEEVRIRALGQNGAVTQLMKALGALPPEERKAQGQANN